MTQEQAEAKVHEIEALCNKPWATYSARPLYIHGKLTEIEIWVKIRVSENSQ